MESPASVVLIGIGWGLTAIVLGVIGLRESRSRMPGAESRAALTRFAAGMTAVLGTASAVLSSRYLGAEQYGRLIPPFVGDAILIAVSAVLLERAFRRQASAFVYPAALGVIIGLSDLNGSYLAKATSSELALLVEGAILLAAGFAFDRLRRRVGGTGEPPPARCPADSRPGLCLSGSARDGDGAPLQVARLRRLSRRAGRGRRGLCPGRARTARRGSR